MKRTYLLVVISLVCSIICAQQWHTTIDILVPQQLHLPQGVSNMLLVNNSCVQPSDLGHALIVDGNQLANREVTLADAAKFLLVSAANEFEGHRRFPNVSVLAETQNKSGNFYARTALTPAQVSSLCSEYMADGLLVLDQLVIYDAEYAQSVGANSAYVNVENEAYMTAQWSVYANGKQQQTFQVTDTLVANEGTMSYVSLLRDFSRREKLLYEMTAVFAEAVVEKFVPQWQTCDRYLYEDSNADIKKGLDAFKHKQWQQAIDIWTNALNAKNKQTRAYAAADIAVAEEILGNFEEAISWTNTAIDLWKTINSSQSVQQQINLKYYIKQLKERKDFQF